MRVVMYCFVLSMYDMKSKKKSRVLNNVGITLWYHENTYCFTIPYSTLPGQHLLTIENA